MRKKRKAMHDMYIYVQTYRDTSFDHSIHGVTTTTTAPDDLNLGRRCRDNDGFLSRRRGGTIFSSIQRDDGSFARRDSSARQRRRSLLLRAAHRARLHHGWSSGHDESIKSVRTFSGAREEKLSSFCLCTSMCADSAILVLFFSYLRTRQSVASKENFHTPAQYVKHRRKQQKARKINWWRAFDEPRVTSGTLLFLLHVRIRRGRWRSDHRVNHSSSTERTRQSTSADRCKMSTWVGLSLLKKSERAVKLARALYLLNLSLFFKSALFHARGYNLAFSPA